MELSIAYYVILFLIFGYSMIYHFPRMNSIPPTPPFPSEPASVNNAINQNEESDEDEEPDYDTPYHHPLWTQPWYHPNFTPEAQRKWREELWYQNMDDLRKKYFLDGRSLCHFPWGYIIYRTVYTPESEKFWPIAMEKLIRGIHAESESDLRRGVDVRAAQLIVESHRDVIISDSSLWDGAGIEQVRSHFVQYLREIKEDKGGGDPRFSVCLVIDEKSLNSILRDGKKGFVGVVDGHYDPNESYDSCYYRGYMRAFIDSLFDLYVNLDWDQMHVRFPGVPDPWISVYDSGNGTGQDEDGNEIPRNFGRMRGSR